MCFLKHGYGVQAGVHDALSSVVERVPCHSLPPPRCRVSAGISRAPREGEGPAPGPANFGQPQLPRIRGEHLGCQEAWHRGPCAAASDDGFDSAIGCLHQPAYQAQVEKGESQVC